MKISKLKLKAVISVVAFVFIGAIIFLAVKNGDKSKGPLDTMTLSQAASQGQMVEMKLLVQIETPQGRADDANSRLERGDVVLAKPVDWQFSDAEKSGFLIIKVKLNETLANLIIHPLFGSSTSKNEPASPEQLKRRKFAVDLAKIGIAKDDEKGREVDDKTFDWNVLTQK